MDKPKRIAFRYDSWRGTVDDLVQVGHLLQQELERAATEAKRRAREELEESHKKQLAEHEKQLRAQAGLGPNDVLPAGLAIQLHQVDMFLQRNKEQLKTQMEALLERGRVLRFEYSDRRGHRRSGTNPEFLAEASNADGVLMQGVVLGPPRASIMLTLQNRPWEWLSLEVEGDDPDWVSSAGHHLNDLLLRHGSKVVAFLRNNWVRSVVGLLAWALFIPPAAALLDRLGVERLVAVAVALVPVAIVAVLYEALFRPLTIRPGRESIWGDILKVAVTTVVGYFLHYALSRLIEVLPSGGP